MGKRSWVHTLGVDRFSALYLAAIFTVIFGISNSGVFLTDTTAKLVASESVIIAVLGLAFLVPLAAGAFDLSIGAVMSFSLLLVNWFAMETGIPALFGALLAILACALIGAISGFFVVRLGVNSFIATLGVGQVVTAAVYFISKSESIIGALPSSYTDLGRDDLLGIPLLVWYLLAIALVLWFVLERTPFGRYLFATGGNADAARLAGVPTAKTVWLSLIASGAIAGLAGVLYSMKIGTFTTVAGPGFLFPAIAAVFFGATQFTRRPNVWGTLVALYALAIGIKGLQLQFPSGGYWIQPLFQGVALLVAISLAAQQTTGKLRRRRGGRFSKRSKESNSNPTEDQ